MRTTPLPDSFYDGRSAQRYGNLGGVVCEDSMAFNRVAAILLVALALAPIGCKRKPVTPQAVDRQPRVPGPSAEELYKQNLDKLKAELLPIPDLGEGVYFTDELGELWTRYPSGLMIRDLKKEDGQVPRLGQKVSVAYVGTMTGRNKEFDRAGKDKPLEFHLGSKDALKGFSMGISTMRLGSKRRMYLPPDLAYGETGAPQPDIGPNQPLIFEVELLKIEGEAVETLIDLSEYRPAGPELPSTAPATHPH